MEMMLFTNALQLAIYVALPVLVAVLLSGLISGVLQSITQVNDDSISFGMRVAAAAITLALFSQFMFSEIEGFARYAWDTSANSPF